MLDATTQSLISAPLVANGEAIGLLCAARGEVDAFDRDHAEIVSEVATQLAMAIHQARLRAALDAEQQRLQAVVEHMPEGVVLLEPDGRIALANPFARARLSAVATTSADGAVTGVGGLSLERLLAGPEIEPREIATDTGSDGVFQVAARPLAGGRGAVVVIREVTREREAQQIALQQARLASVGQLAGGIAHDFNNILIAIVELRRLGMRKRSVAVRARPAGGDRRAGRAGDRARAPASSTSAGSRCPRAPRSTVPAPGAATIGLLERMLPESIRITVDVDRLDARHRRRRDAAPADAHEPRGQLARRHAGEAGRSTSPSPHPRGRGRRSARGPGRGSSSRCRQRRRDAAGDFATRLRPVLHDQAPGRGIGLGLSQAPAS